MGNIDFDPHQVIESPIRAEIRGRTARNRFPDDSGSGRKSGNNKRCMQIGGAGAESEALDCYGGAERNWSDGISTKSAVCICRPGNILKPWVVINRRGFAKAMAATIAASNASTSST